MDRWSFVETAIFIFILSIFGIYVQRIDQRVRAAKNQLGRLSLTFLKIENDLATIQHSLLVLSRSQDNDAAEKIGKIVEQRERNLAFIVREGNSTSQIMRGLELPDIDDDPNFWSPDRMKKFGFETSSESDGGTN